MAPLRSSLLEPGRAGAKRRRDTLFYLGLAAVGLVALVVIRGSGPGPLGLARGLAPAATQAALPCQAGRAGSVGGAWPPGGAGAGCPPYGDVVQAATEREKHPILNQVVGGVGSA